MGHSLMIEMKDGSVNVCCETIIGGGGGEGSDVCLIILHGVQDATTRKRN